MIIRFLKKVVVFLLLFFYQKLFNVLNFLIIPSICLIISSLFKVNGIFLPFMKKVVEILLLFSYQKLSAVLNFLIII